MKRKNPRCLCPRGPDDFESACPGNCSAAQPVSVDADTREGTAQKKRLDPSLLATSAQETRVVSSVPEPRECGPISTAAALTFGARGVNFSIQGFKLELLEKIKAYIGPHSSHKFRYNVFLYEEALVVCCLCSP